MNRNEKTPSVHEIEAIGTLGSDSIHNLNSNYSETELKVIEEKYLAQKELAFWELGYRYKWLLFAFCSACGLFFSWKAEAVHGWMNAWNFSNAFIYGVTGFGGSLVTFSLLDLGRICLFFKSRKEKEEVDHMVTKVAKMMAKAAKSREEVVGSKEVEEVAEEEAEQLQEEEVEVEAAALLQEEEVEVEAAALLQEEEVEVVEEKKSFLALCFCLLEGLQNGEGGEKMSCSEIAEQLNLNAANSLIGRAMGACKFVCMRQNGRRFWKVRISRKVGLLEVSPTCDS